MKSDKKQIRSRWLRKLMRVHIVVTALSLSAYFLVAFFDPGFLSYDLRQKYHALADMITVTATVLGPPVQPIVTGIARCSTTRGLRNFLDWPDDINTYTYDINRDGLSLVTGLTGSFYNDTGVALNSTHEYMVTANGPMGPGFATSDAISVTTPSECVATVSAPGVNIIPSGNQPLALNNDGLVNMTDLQPVFSGTSTMPYAIVHIQLASPVVFIATVIADAGGYWSWSPPTQLSLEAHTLTVRAVDPDDPSIIEISSFSFAVVGVAGNGSESHNAKTNRGQRTPVTLAPTPSVAALIPFDFLLSVGNGNQTVAQGQDAQIVLRIADVPKQYDGTTTSVRYNLIDEKGSVVASINRNVFLKKGQETHENFPIPSYMAPGNYSFQAKISLDGINASSSTAEFSVTEILLVNFGGGTAVTYAEVTRNIGWIVLILLISLLLWLFMFMREYGMYLRAIRHIAEQQLMNAGFITKRKGVIR